MKKLMIIHGMKRSGNHAIIGWLCNQGRFLFFNNVIPIAPILRRERKCPPTTDFAVWLRHRCPHALHRFFGHYHTVIASLEDHSLHIRPFCNMPAAVTTILIVRDPRNLFASRIRKSSLMPNHPSYPHTMGPNMQRAVNLWKQHAQECLGVTNHLENKVCLYFNSWFSDSMYRRDISRQLNLNFTDKGFSQVSHIGGGSSFEGTQLDGASGKMNVLNRELDLTDSEALLLEKLFEDRELQDLERELSARYGQ